MATRTQGLLLGCSLILVIGMALVTLVAVFATGIRPDGAGLFAAGDIGLVIIQGPINGSRETVRELDSHRRDDSIRAVVVRLESPGGAVAASQEIHAAMLRLRNEKPVVASLGSVAASGAYYVAVGADSIVADPGSLTGSIGVIIAYPTAVELMDRVGVEMKVHKSGTFKDMGSYARKPTEGDEEIFDSVIRDVYDQFVTAVAEGRGMERDRVLALADGRILSGRQAHELGLVDRLGDLHFAASVAAAMVGLAGEPVLVRKDRPGVPFLDFLDQFLRDGAETAWGPRLEYRLR